MYAAFAILAALHAGGGRTLDVSLWETALSFVSYHLIGNIETGSVPTPQGTGFHAIAPYQVFPAADGGLMITAANDGLFRRLAEAIGLPELADDPRFATNPDRVTNRAALAEALSARLRERPARGLAGDARRRRRPRRTGAGRRRGRRRPADSRRSGSCSASAPTPRSGPAFSADGERPEYRSPPPALGEHTAEVLARGRLLAEEVEGLAAAGVIRTGD